MKLFRFHLSTLLLASIFAGAAMGVWFASAVWQRQYSLAVEGLPSQRAAMAFDANRTHLFVCQNGEAYLFDLASKRALWQRSFYTQAYGDAAARFSTDGSLIELGFPEDQSPTEMQIHRARFLSVADGMDVERPTSVAPWRTDYYLVRRWDDDIDDPQMSKIRVRPSPEFFRYLRVTRGISPDGREVCDGAMIFSLQNHALGKSLHLFPNVNEDISGRGPAAYSPDGNWLAISNENGLAIWRRMRGYGWKGCLELPLFWIAAVSLVWLMVLFGRWIARSIRMRVKI